MKIKEYLIFVIGILLFYSCSNKSKSNLEKSDSTTVVKITVFAAAGVTEPLQEIMELFSQNNSVEFISNFASTGTLARQIEQSEVPDIFISANKKWMKYIDSLGVIQKNSIQDIVKDKLVLIAPIHSKIDSSSIDSTYNLLEYISTNKLAIGNPAHVPAGEYAKQSLDYFGWYTKLQKNILLATDVRNAVMLVEMEEALFGIAYYTVAIKSNKVKIIGVFPENSHKSILFTGALCSNNKIAKDFYTFIFSKEAHAIWKKYGYK